MLLSTFIKEGTESLESLYPTAEARQIVLMLCEDILGTKSYTHIVEPQFTIPSSKEPVLGKAMERLCQGEPIQYVTSKAEWCGMVFKVNRNVLIPRPETELLCRQAISTGKRIQRMRLPYGKKATPVRVLDLCTGSGCIAWNTALNIPGAKVVGVDISAEAIAVAASQDFSAALKENGASAPLFIQGDILSDGSEWTGKLHYDRFDLLLSNPPYIMESEKPLLRKNVVDFEPEGALFVPDEDPLVFYRAIAKWSVSLLDEEGTGLTEINEVLGKETQEVFRNEGFSTEIIKDFYDRNRFILYRKQK